MKVYSGKIHDRVYKTMINNGRNESSPYRDQILSGSHGLEIWCVFCMDFEWLALIIKDHKADANKFTMYFLYTKKQKKVHGKHIFYIYRCGILEQENVPGTSFIPIIDEGLRGRKMMMNTSTFDTLHALVLQDLQDLHEIQKRGWFVLPMTRLVKEEHIGRCCYLAEEFLEPAELQALKDKIGLDEQQWHAYKLKITGP